MILSITKIALVSYSKLIPFFKFNSQIINELKQSPCKKFKVTGSWNLKVWYTMTLWRDENELNSFYRSGTHVEAMRQSKRFSSHIQSTRMHAQDLIGWTEAKRLFFKNQK